MCGISGIATADGLRQDDSRLVGRMLESLSHRGPDDQYTLGDDRAMLGARRLSIIDLSGGRQPLTDESGLIIATQNGEIYNYVELREDLERRRHVFHTQCDTEVIVHLYEDFGTDFVQHLRGMFAVAIWDGRVGRLVLARDRLGKKPLYWRVAEGRLSYGSELKALLEDASLPRKVDRESLALYLHYQYVPAPRSIFEGVAKLPPATVLTWDGGEPKLERYWRPVYGPKTLRDIQDDVAEGLSLLRESVRLRLRSDVPVGVFLSGGMDSSVVTALMAESMPEPVRTFSIGFEDEAYNELPYARAVAQYFGTAHTEETVRLDALELLPELGEHFDEPFADASALPTFRVSQLAAQQLKVVLTGDGGDESFGGYERYRLQRKLATFDSVPRGVLRGAARAGKFVTAPLGNRSRLRRGFRAAERLAGLDRDQRYLGLMTIMSDSQRARLVGDLDSRVTDAYLLDVLTSCPTDQVDRMLCADVLTYLPEDLLVKVDRATMANSLEARAPLLDHRLVEFAATLPVDRKISGGTSKVLLRTIAKKLMPTEMVERPKKGFGVPIGDWFRGPLGARFTELVLAPDAASRAHLDTSLVAGMLAEHATRRAEHGHRLWALLMFETWARRWASRGPGTDP